MSLIYLVDKKLVRKLKNIATPEYLANKYPGRQMTLYFSQGYGISGEPTAADVLNCLASDSSSVENARSFEDWASDLGYDLDSRKAEKIFKTCEKQAERLKKFLGEELYKTLLWDTEGL